jgi:peptidoglycan hydrolase-like protein with peptidoglycan-binding domain
MILLKEGSTGDEVIQLQSKLKSLGFDIGTVDGDFGPKTTAAVVAFQQSKNLSADGVVGQQTLDALGLVFSAPTSNGPGPSVTADVTPEIVSKMFPFTPINNIRTNLPFVLAALDADNLGDKEMVLMALGTIRAETGSFQPISEGISRFNTSAGGHPFNLYDNRSDLGNQGPPDGASFKGRGFVQLTGRANYTKFSAELGMGDKLVVQPDLANDPQIAAQLLALFLKDKEAAIRRALANNDLATARRLVNGGSHGLSDFSSAYHIGEGLIP